MEKAIEYQLPFTAEEVHMKLDKIDGDSEYYSAGEIDEQSKLKADLINGKIPVNQLDVIDGLNNTSLNPITSKAVYDALQSKQDNSNLTTIIDGSSTDATYPSSKAVYNAILSRQPILVFDTEPTIGSSRPVTSNGIKTAINEIIQIAEGKCKAYVIDDVDTMVDWLTNYADTSTLNTGDIFLIRDIGVPDYWWEPQTELMLLSEYTYKDIIIGNKGAARVLETTKIDLSEYALSGDLTSIQQALEEISSSLSTVAKTGNYSDLKNKPIISNKANTGTDTWYFPLGKMEIDNSGNFGNFTFTGRLGGWTNANTAVYSIMLMNRGNYDGNVITATVTASGQYTNAIGIVDIIVSKNDDLSHTVYLKCNGYFCYDFTWTSYQHSIIYDDSYTTIEPNNIIWKLSEAPKTILDTSGGFSASGGINASKFAGYGLRIVTDPNDPGVQGYFTVIIEG